MVLCALALFVVSLGYGVVVPLLPELAGVSDTGSASALSIVYAAYAAAKIGAQVPGGAWVDTVGGKRVLRAGIVLFTLSLVGFLFPLGAAWFAFVRTVEGAATGLVYPAVFALVLRGGVEKGSGKRIGAVSGIGTSGLLVGPAIAGALANQGARAAVLAALGVSVVICAFVLAGQGLGEDEPRVAGRRTVTSEVRNLVALATTAGFLALCLPIAFNKLTFSAFQGLLPLHGPTLGLGVRGVSALFAATGIVFGASQALGGVLVDKFTPRGVVLALTVPLLVSLGVLPLTTAPLVFGAAYLAYVCASSIIFTATLKHAARAFGTEDTYGGVFGVLGTLTDLMTIVGPLVFLNLYRPLGGWVFAAMAVCGVPFALGFVRGKSRVTLAPEAA